jgi:hypothetical protein
MNNVLKVKLEVFPIIDATIEVLHLGRQWTLLSVLPFLVTGL